jgi:hypothetical protein
MTFQVDLREFRLAVGAQVLVAEATGNLEIAVESRDHQNLFEDLRRLRQRVELAVMHAAGNQIVARALGRRARQNRRLDFVEAERVHGFAHLEDDAMAQRQIALRARPAQIEIAIVQPGLLAGVDLVLDDEWRRLGGIQDAQLGGKNFYLAAGQLRIGLLPQRHAPANGDNIFRA